MPRRRPVITATVVALLVAGCSDDKRELERGLETPTFAPAPSMGGESPAGDPGATSTTTPLSGSPTTAAGRAPTGTSSDGPTTEAAVTDPEGDTTLSPIDPPPPWADLLGARLVRSVSGFELRIRLGGGDAPEEAPADDHTMNIASFYDVDGDGSIDYECWANIASGGWGGSYWNNDRGTAAFLEDSRVEITTEGDEVVLRFPLTHLGEAETFRWSIASEWGRYEAIGTPAMVRDDVPDNDQAASFPGS